MTTSRRDKSRASAGDLPFEIVQLLADGVHPKELAAAQRDRLRERALLAARDTPPEGTTTLRSGAADWLEIAPRVQVRELRRDAHNKAHISLLRMQPGGRIPAHRHTQEEDFIILDGECRIGAHRLQAGDIHTAAAGSIHDHVTTDSGVLVLLRGEFPYPTEIEGAR